jgi:hypothetical protein
LEVMRREIHLLQMKFECLHGDLWGKEHRTEAELQSDRLVLHDCILIEEDYLVGIRGPIVDRY